MGMGGGERPRSASRADASVGACADDDSSLSIDRMICCGCCEVIADTVVGIGAGEGAATLAATGGELTDANIESSSAIPFGLPTIGLIVGCG